jgi:hypothetical protein
MRKKAGDRYDRSKQLELSVCFLGVQRGPLRHVCANKQEEFTVTCTTDWNARPPRYSCATVFFLSNILSFKIKQTPISFL